MTVLLTDDGSYSKIHPDHGEAYHSRGGAKKEAQGLYIQGSGFREFLRGRTREVRVLDLGLGLGYNALSTLEAWVQVKDAPPLSMWSLEQDPELLRELLSGQAPWQKGWPGLWIFWVQAQAAGLKLQHPNGAQGTWEILLGDALEAQLPVGVHFIWQDFFSPPKNPDLWTGAWFETLAQASGEGACLMTYTVAGAIRRALQGAGWAWEKIPGGQGKKEWLRARRTPQVPWV
jgi:tRNA U34 5-methylaminomethyl-2-thiouridine-forming methyltransferase MnmC